MKSGVPTAVSPLEHASTTPLAVARGHWLLGNLGAFARDPLDALVQFARTHGDAVRLRFPLGSTYLFNHPDAYKRILQDNNSNYVKSRSYHKMREFLGQGLLTSEGEFWRRQRRLIQPAFHKDRLRALGSRMVDETNRLVAGWSERARSGAEIDIHAEMMRLTMRIAARCLFSYDVAGDAESRVDAAMEFIQEHIFHRTATLLDIPPWIPTARNRRYLAAVRDLDGIVFDMIRQRRGQDPGAFEHDVMDMLLRARDEDSGAAMDDKQIRDEIMTLFLAGHETTANAMSFLLYLLCAHPQVEARVREEYDRVVPGRDPEPDDLAALEYVPRVIKEALRMYPPAWIIERAALEPDTVMGHPLPRRGWVVLCTYALHHHPGLWSDPERFDPDRFLPEADKQRPRYAWVPFGGGPRQCIGLAFAMMEMQLALPVLLRRFRMELDPAFQLELQPRITLRPGGTIPVRLHPR